MKEELQRNIEGPLVDSRYKYPIRADASVLIKEMCDGDRKSPDRIMGTRLGELSQLALFRSRQLHYKTTRSSS